jgi:hypothetical protein
MLFKKFEEVDKCSNAGIHYIVPYSVMGSCGMRGFKGAKLRDF